MTLVAYIAYVATPYSLKEALSTAIKATKGIGKSKATRDKSDLSDKRSKATFTTQPWRATRGRGS
jgi:hypothetical protein